MIALDQKAAAPPAGTGLQKEQAVQRMFSSIARYYDLNNSLLSLGLHHKWKREAVGFVPVGSKFILDIGAGTGDVALLTANRISPSGLIIAADLNHPMLAVGATKILRARLNRQILCVQANADRISARDGAFDAVTTGFCLRNVGDLHAVTLTPDRLAIASQTVILRHGAGVLAVEHSRVGAVYFSDPDGIYQLVRTP